MGEDGTATVEKEVCAELGTGSGDPAECAKVMVNDVVYHERVIQAVSVIVDAGTTSVDGVDILKGLPYLFEREGLS